MKLFSLPSLPNISGPAETQPRSTSQTRAALLAALVLLSPALAVIARGAYRSRPRKDTYALVVMGAAQYNGRPSQQFAGRLQWAARLWDGCRRLEVITVGGKLPGDVHTEAEVAREFLITEHVDPLAITALPVGNDTRGSFDAVRKHLEQVGKPGAKLLVISDPLHALRCEAIGAQEGLRVRSSPTPFSPVEPLSRRWFKDLLHESGGMVAVGVAWVFGTQARVMVESGLRDLAASLWPRRQKRYDVLKAQHSTSQQSEG